jgi:hypothetical protein
MNSVNNLGTAFDELANDAYAAKEAERARVDATAASVAQTSSIVTGSKDFAGVAEEMGAQAFDNYDDKVAE